MNASSSFPSLAAALDAADSPANAITAVIAFWIQNGMPFTSGHVVNAIRQHRRDLGISQAKAGLTIRTLFESGEMPSYEGGIYPERILRTTTLDPATGATRTPIGTDVYVYAPSMDEALSFEFELNIAQAPSVSDGQGGQISAAAALLFATPGLAPGAPGASLIPPVTPSGIVAKAAGRPLTAPVKAVVHADGRLCVPRVALEALAFESKRVIVGGEPLYMHMGTGVRITLDPTNDPSEVEVTPTTDRLRLHLVVPGVGGVGDTADVTVDSDGITLTL